MTTELLVDRPRSAEDWQAVRDICCETGASGKPIEPKERWPFFAEYWIGPYQKLLPNWTFVAREEGKVIGYLTGCPETAGFNRRRTLYHRTGLLLSAIGGKWGNTEDVRRFLKPFEGARRALQFRFGLKVFELLRRRYPAHLHINVREGKRGGTGRAIMNAYLGALDEAKVPGLHLFCGEGPVPFYRRVGFHRLARLDFGKGPVSIMVRRV